MTLILFKTEAKMDRTDAQSTIRDTSKTGMGGYTLKNFWGD